MKTLNKLFTLLTSVFLILSCTDKLDETPIDSIGSEYIYGSETGLESAVTGLYNQMRTLNYSEGTGGQILSSMLLRVATDLGHARVALDLAYNPALFSPTGPVPHEWGQLYFIVARCNGIITYGANVDMDQTKKDILLAQAHAIRAEVYMQLYTIYNKIILYTEPEYPSDDYTPANPADIWALVDSDLDFAVSKLPWPVEPGRYGQAVARHLRGISALWQEDWQEAVTQFDAIVDSGMYQLVPLDQVFVGDENHAESIYTYQTSQALAGGNDTAGGGPSCLASMFNNRYYEISTGEMIQAVDIGGQAFGWEFPNDYCQSLYDRVNDKRYTTYYYDQNYIVNNPNSPNFGQPLPQSSIPDNFRQYHFSLKKFHDPNKPATADVSYQNFLHYRFAEVLLLGAEAHWELSGRNSTDAKALEYINKVRRRAYFGVPGSTDTTYDYTSINEDNYLEESARELALEWGRYTLLKRRGLLMERVRLHFTSGSNSGNITGRSTAPDYMQHFPIPQSQIDLMGDPSFQNPGY